jgi:predicted outer membrane lipoprotein
MNTAPASSPQHRWPFARILILLLAGAFAGLMVDIRVEHVDVVRERSVAWVPIIYSGFMTIACLAAFVFWNKTIRRIMLPLFLSALVIGGLGFYLHNHGNLKQVLKTSADAWTDPKMNHSDEPPQVAPLAFAGLGVIGMLASIERFN